MFFKKREPDVSSTFAEEDVVMSSELKPEISLQDRAEMVAEALRSFEEQAHKEGIVTPDQELVAAREMVDAAKTIILDGRLSYALLRQLLSEVSHWPSWSQRDDFETWKNFSCDLVKADRETVDLQYRNGELTTVSFTFSGRDYRVTHLDRGWSSAPDTNHKRSDVSFYAGDILVMELSATSEATDDYWKFEGVKALRISDGIWMTDLLKIASEIEKTYQDRLKKYFDDELRETAKNIEL